MAIEFEAKTDRELLVLTAQTCNNINTHLEKMNGTLGDHEERIDDLEKQEPTSKIKATSITAGIALGISAAVAYIFNKLGIG